jgi:hypothetical protein
MEDLAGNKKGNKPLGNWGLHTKIVLEWILKLKS